MKPIHLTLAISLAAGAALARDDPNLDDPGRQRSDWRRRAPIDRIGGILQQIGQCLPDLAQIADAIHWIARKVSAELDLGAGVALKG